MPVRVLRHTKWIIPVYSLMDLESSPFGSKWYTPSPWLSVEHRRGTTDPGVDLLNFRPRILWDFWGNKCLRWPSTTTDSRSPESCRGVPVEVHQKLYLTKLKRISYHRFKVSTCGTLSLPPVHSWSTFDTLEDLRSKPRCMQWGGGKTIGSVKVSG